MSEKEKSLENAKKKMGETKENKTNKKISTSNKRVSSNSKKNVAKNQTKKDSAKEVSNEKVTAEKTKQKPNEKNATKNSKKVIVKKSDNDKVIKSSLTNGKELVELNKKNKIKKEETIIEKIKSFLAKVAAMQEEAKKEFAEIKANVKIKKEKVEKENNKDKNTEIQTNYLLEYYDLPYRYNETVVKVLAQTPKKLFVYWDISDNDRDKYIKTFGENFFQDTYPVLLLFNEEKKYIKEIAINDFANSWYIDIDDPKTKYTIQLGRKFKNRPEIVNVAVMNEEKIILQTDYLPIAMSNKIEAPNDHILFENFMPQITFRNVKTNQETIKDIRTFDKKIAKAYNLKSFYDVYKDLYKDEIENASFDLNNPTSSNMTSSSFK